MRHHGRNRAVNANLDPQRAGIFGVHEIFRIFLERKPGFCVYHFEWGKFFPTRREGAALSQDVKSPENLYLVGALLVFLLLPFQNCTYSPVSLQFTSAWADADPGFRCETSRPDLELARSEGRVRPQSFIR